MQSCYSLSRKNKKLLYSSAQTHDDDVWLCNAIFVFYFQNINLSSRNTLWRTNITGIYTLTRSPVNFRQNRIYDSCTRTMTLAKYKRLYNIHRIVIKYYASKKRRRRCRWEHYSIVCIRSWRKGRFRSLFEPIMVGHHRNRADQISCRIIIIIIMGRLTFETLNQNIILFSHTHVVVRLDVQTTNERVEDAILWLITVYWADEQQRVSIKCNATTDDDVLI